MNYEPPPPDGALLQDPAPHVPPERRELALVLTGGGARAAYQVGVLDWIARHRPGFRAPIVTGVSAGAVNAAHIASHHGTFAQTMAELVGLWSNLRVEDVFRVDPLSLGWIGIRWGLRIVSGGRGNMPEVQGLLDTQPLREFLGEVLAAVEGRLSGIEYNLARGTLRAVALSTTSYTTGQSVVWVQGRDIELWTRPKRRSLKVQLAVEHVMASAALPLFFPAVRLRGAWYGDGGIRLTAPLSPALHLGAQRILAISTRYERNQAEGDRPAFLGYPAPAQVLGMLMNAIFLDLIDQDALRLERLNRLLAKLPVEEREGMRIIRLLVLRPSQDLARLAGEFEPRLPGSIRYLTGGLGARETASPDLLSMLMFQPDYLERLIELGRADAERHAEAIHQLLDDGAGGTGEAGLLDQPA